MKTLTFDFIVVGSGLAGLLAAFHAADYGTVALISKSELDISNSYHAQGGIAAAIGEDDHPRFHFEDTLIAGRNLCDRDAVSLLVNEGLDRVNELIERGMDFDKDVEENVCKGIQTLQYTDGENIIFLGKATILATGGLSRLYSRSTNPYTATGDGIALAWQAGARLADMEFIQFHPTALSIPGEEAYLISEAIRGEGAHLLDVNGIRFMPDIHPLAELAPRDVVSSAIFKRMQETGSNVFLSLRHLHNENLIERFHSIDAHLKPLGINLLTDLIPIAPAAHYMVGGVRTDIWGQTSITGLFACGEVASTGVMGANRLASNSLLECLVYGKRVIEKARHLNISMPLTFKQEPILLCQKTDSEFLKVKNELANVMSDQVGIVRDASGLHSALARINSISEHYKESGTDYNFHKIINLTDICRLITLSAIERKESRGGHVRIDFPFEIEEELHHIIQEKGNKIQYEAVRIS